LSFDETMKYLFDPKLTGMKGGFKRHKKGEIEVEIELDLNSLIPTLIKMQAINGALFLKPNFILVSP